jgi:hypothetical protein
MTTLFRELAEGDEPRALTRGLWARRAVLTILAIAVLLALLDVFGQRASRTEAAGGGDGAATLALRAPDTVRGGLLFQSTIEIAARRDLDHPRLVLARGWTDGMQVNSISPDAESQAQRAGDRLVLTYPALAAGDELTIRLQFQVDPTHVGRRPYDVELDDAETSVARVHRTITTLP